MRVVHCKKEKYDCYCGRPGKFGNPFIIGRDGDRAEVIRKFREWFLAKTDHMEILKELSQYETLACWCSPEPCHCDVYIELIEKYGLSSLLPTPQNHPRTEGK